MSLTRLLLARHGETDWNAEGRLQGKTDRPLNDVGRRQAALLAERLAAAPVTAVYSSDLARARETAEIVARRLGLDVEVEADLREKDWGTWEGLTGDEREHVEFVGEATRDHALRVLGAVRRIAERHPDETVLVVTHGGSLRRIQAAVVGFAEPVVDNCEVWELGHEDGTFRAVD